MRRSSKPMQQLFASATPEENEQPSSDEENIPPAPMETDDMLVPDVEGEAAEDKPMDVEPEATKLQTDDENPF